MNTPNLVSKSQGRAHIKSVLNRFFENVDKKETDEIIGKNVSQLIGQLFSSGFSWGASFAGDNFEPRLSLPSEYHLTFPQVQSETAMQFVHPEESKWSKNQWGIDEPTKNTGTLVAIQHHDFILVPALAFSQEGHRLGRGKAYYDRALSNYSKMKIGVGYSVQMISDLWQEEAHDIQMNYLVTERYIVKVNEKPPLTVH